MLKSFITITTIAAMTGLANAEAHPLFEGKTVSDWTQVSDKQWSRYIESDGELIRIDYVTPDDAPAGFTVRRDCGDGTISFGVIRANAQVGFESACGKTTNYTYGLKALVDEAGQP